MSHKFSGRMTRRDFIRALGILGAAVVVEGCATPTATPTAVPTKAPAPTSVPPPTAAPPPTTAPTAPPVATVAPTAIPKPTVAARPDWATAAKQFAGKSIGGLAPNADFTSYWPKRATEFTNLSGVKTSIDLIASGDPFWAKIESELRGRTGNVSFFTVDPANTSLYQKAGALLLLDPYLADPKFPDWEISDVPQAVLDYMGRRDGKMYALPCSGDVQIMYCRKDLLDAAGLKPPATWQEVYDVAKKLKKADMWGAAWEMAGRYAALRFSNALPPGLTWLDKDMRLSALRDKRTIEIMQIWRQMLKEELLPPDTLTMDPNTALTLYTSGRAALSPVNWPGNVVVIEDPEKSKIVGKSIPAIMPGGEGNASGWNLAVSVDAKDKDLAFLTIAWLSSKQISLRNAIEETDMGSFRTSVSTDKSIQDLFLKKPNGPAVVAAYAMKAEALKKARFQPAIAEWSGPCINAISPIFQKIMAGDLPVEQGMNQAADAGEKILADAGYYKK